MAPVPPTPSALAADSPGTAAAISETHGGVIDGEDLVDSATVAHAHRRLQLYRRRRARRTAIARASRARNRR